MKPKSAISLDTSTITSDELYEMANLFPRTTGLPMTVWVGPRGSAQHDVRIKVSTTHGNRMNIDDAASVAVPPQPHVVVGTLSASDQRGVFDWITLNAPTIVAYWDGSIDTAELIQALKRMNS